MLALFIFFWGGFECELPGRQDGGCVGNWEEGLGVGAGGGALRVGGERGGVGA